jgi:hypothetical protein
MEDMKSQPQVHIGFTACKMNTVLTISTDFGAHAENSHGLWRYFSDAEQTIKLDKLWFSDIHFEKGITIPFRYGGNRQVQSELFLL